MNALLSRSLGCTLQFDDQRRMHVRSHQRKDDAETEGQIRARVVARVKSWRVPSLKIEGPSETLLHTHSLIQTNHGGSG